MRPFTALLLAGFLAAGATAADLTGTWKAGLPRRGGVTQPLYLILQQDGTRLSGHIIAPAGGDLPLLDPHFEGDVAVFHTQWGMTYRLTPAGDQLRVAVVYEWRERDDAVAVRVAPEETRPPAPRPPPPLRILPPDGLALTPPMGWNSWNHFGERIDDATVREIADALVSSGLAAAGYVTVTIDDTWEGGRDAAGQLVPNGKFPDMKALGDYLHGRGLKFGLYSSPGDVTCAGYPGSFGHEEQDARTFAAWGVDYLKYDWCGAGAIYREADQQAICQRMAEALRQCGRPIVYSLSLGGEPWLWGAMAGAHLWRTTGDIRDTWDSVSAIGFAQSRLAAYAGPGHWNDPDMLEVGNGGMTPDEYRAHFTLWCLLAAPLIAGNDIRQMSPDTLAILGNRELIAIDQDPLGRAGTRYASRDDVEIWTRPLADGGLALGVFNRSDHEQTFRFPWSELFGSGAPTEVRDLWEHADLAPVGPMFARRIPAHGVVAVRAR